MPLSDQQRPYICLDAVHDIFSAVVGQQVSCKLCCVHAGIRVVIQVGQDLHRVHKDG